MGLQIEEFLDYEPRFQRLPGPLQAGQVKAFSPSGDAAPGTFNPLFGQRNAKRCPQVQIDQMQGTSVRQPDANPQKRAVPLKLERARPACRQLQLYRRHQPVPETFRSEEHTSELQSRENLVC